MLTDHDTTRDVLARLDRFNTRLIESIQRVKAGCPEAEFLAYRRAAGYVLGYLYLDVVRPLHKRHPDLEPEELRS